MKIDKYKNKMKNKNKIQETELHALSRFPAGSFAVHIGDHFRFGIISGPIWGSFPVWGSFAVGDYLRRCTAHVLVKSHETTFGAITCQCVISFYIMVFSSGFLQF